MVADVYTEAAADALLLAVILLGITVISRLWPSSLERLVAYFSHGRRVTCTCKSYDTEKEGMESWSTGKEDPTLPTPSSSSSSLQDKLSPPGCGGASRSLWPADAGADEPTMEALPTTQCSLWPADTAKNEPKAADESGALALSHLWPMAKDADQAEEEEAELAEDDEPLPSLWASMPEDDADASGPEAAAVADASRTLEAALASGDARLAESALSAGLRFCSASWLARALDQVAEIRVQVHHELLLRIIDFFGREHRADLAADVWERQWEEIVLEPGDFSESAMELYGAALEACARCGDFDTALRVASDSDWRVPPCRFSQAALLALARWLARRQDIDRALECYEAVRRARSGAADLATHRVLVVAIVRSGNMAQADTLFQELVASGIPPDGTTYSAMVCGYCTAGNVDKAMDYFNAMRRRDIVPTAPLFDAILDGCAWTNMPSLMEQVLAEMEATGVRPSTSTLSILLRQYGSSRDTARALAVFDDLPKRHGFELDAQAYGTLISVCLRNGCFDLAIGAYEGMSPAGLTPSARTYEALIMACMRRGHLDQAVKLVDDALSLNAVQVDETAAPRAHLEAKVVEEVLRLIGRRHEAQRLGAPLVARLRVAGIEVSESLAEAVDRAAQAEQQHEDGASSLCQWRKQREVSLGPVRG